MTGMGAVFRREFRSYFAAPIALVYIVVFLAASGIFTFSLGGFFERGQADLETFFFYHPWLYLFLVPSIAMRLWAEDRRQGTFELVLTLPVSAGAVVGGKFLAAWAFTTFALSLTFPLWITVNWLGQPDNGVIAAGYAGSLLMAGAYLAIGAAISAMTRNQVAAFAATVLACFLFLMSGLPFVTEFVLGLAGAEAARLVASFSFLTQFSSLLTGVLEARAVLFFASLIAFWLFVNLIAVERAREKG
ncbi:MAG TPA: ABC transporter permease [Sphingomonadales bacterium]|nr:ABC transporter permease [Sphingomonadales bacterium]